MIPQVLKLLKSFLFIGLFLLSPLALANELTALRHLAVQDAGRIKPFDTFARESLQLVYGKSTFNKKDASEIVFTWFLLPQHWDSKEIIQIRRNAIKEALKLEVSKTYFTPQELITNERIPLLLQELHNKVAAKEKLEPYFQDVQRLENQLGLYRAINNGVALKFIPPKEGDAWVSLQDAPPEWKTRFQELTTAFAKGIAEPPEPGMKAEVEKFQAAARSENPAIYPDQKIIDLEVHYNLLHPFMWAWIIYLVAVLLIGWAWIGANNFAYKLSWVAMLVGFSLHIYGFALRCYLAGRPPVSNMYESIVWVSFGAVLIGMVFEAIKRRMFANLAAGIVGVLCLMTADFSPTVFDASIQPLEPVLRSNLWLTIHVLTITLSYSAFFLALLMGDVGLMFFLKGLRQRGEELGEAAYRVVQVGVVLLAAGTILGGVWADYSWGRFWGWDPKETWALIALLGYLAILHARKAGLVRNFGFLASCVGAFSLVLMAWYGVNFVLGVGLHSYGFGGGGTPLVAAFIAAHLVYVAFAVTVQKNLSKSA